MARPRVLILDEPCAGLDPAAREHFLQFIQRLGQAQNSPTLILVTHHVEEIMPVFSHVLALQNGRVLAAGKKADTFEFPEFVRRLQCPHEIAEPESPLYFERPLSGGEDANR